jgi:glucuronoarabinoxylan endo-1,4-beta-xylanase
MRIPSVSAAPRPGAPALRRLGLALALVCLGLGTACPPYVPHPGVRVTLDPATTFQTLEGIGGSAADESALRAMAEPYRTQVLDLVFGDLEPSVVRLKVRPAIEPVNDDADPAHVNPAGFARPDDLLWQLDEIFARGHPKTIAAMWTPPAWMKTTGQECCGGTLKAGYEAELAELFSVWLGYLEADGHPLDSLSIQNEPEAASPWDANTYSPPHMATVIEAVAQRLVADGHTTRLHAPDNAVAGFVYLYLPYLLAEPTAGPLLDAVAFHLYGSTDYTDPATAAGDLDAAAEAEAAAPPPHRPLWMTEFSNTTLQGYGTWDEGLWQAELIHEALVHDVTLYAMWNLYRPGGPGEAAIVIPPTGDGTPYTITPKYWTLRQYTRYLKPGAVRIAATTNDSDVLVTAWTDATAHTLTVVAINEAADARWLVFQGAPLEGPPTVVRSSETEQGFELPADSPDRMTSRNVLVPARSVATLVWPTPD